MKQPKSKYYRRINNGTTWPVVSEEMHELSWRLNHGTEPLTVSDRRILSSVIHAYDSLIRSTQKRRNSVCSQLKKDGE